MPPPNKQAFEVHGDIRAKYQALGGASGPLGLPLTDETVAPDGRGRYNHFEHGSIYWTDRTGPMMVRGTVRDRWAASGWETRSARLPRSGSAPDEVARAVAAD